MAEGKICARCKVKKELSQYGRDRYAQDGLRRYCRECVKEIDRHYYTKSPHKLEYNILYYRKRREEARKKYGDRIPLSDKKGNGIKRTEEGT